jgi:hypothetical protein
MTNLTSPACWKPELWWHDLYYTALFETDRTKLPERIAEAEKAILARIKELFAVTSDHIEEDQVLDDALYALRALRSCVATQVNAA